MAQLLRRDFVQTAHLCRFAMAIAIVITLCLTEVAWAGMSRQEPFPPCPENHRTYFFSSSPSYKQDSILYLSTVNPGTVWRSDDAGSTWNNLVDMSRFDGFRFGPVTVVPVASSTGFHLYNGWTTISDFSVTARLLWYSDDSGASWQARDPSPGEARSNIFPTDDLDIMFALENSSPSWIPTGIWRTHSGARSWIEVWDGTEALGLAVSPVYSQDQTVFASLVARSPELGSPVIVSNDGGETWQGRGGDDLCDDPASSLQLSPAFAQDRTLFVQQSGSFFRSRDAGQTWQVVFPPDRPHCQGGVVAPLVAQFVLSPNYDQDHTIYMVSSTGDYRLSVSDNDGETWTPLLRNRLLHVYAVLSTPAASSSTSASRDQPGRVSSGPRVVRQHAAEPDSSWNVFLPRVDWTATQPVARPLTLFIMARNEDDKSTYYRSDDGGVTWACMALPTVEPPLRSQTHGRGR